MADDEGLLGDKSKGKKDYKTYIYIGVAVVGVIITYLIYSKTTGASSSTSGGSSGNQSPQSAPVVYSSGGGSGGQSAASAAGIAQIEQQLATMTSSNNGTSTSGLTSSVPTSYPGYPMIPTSSPTSISTPTTNSASLPPIINTAQGQMYVLGGGSTKYNSPGSNSYEVYGGAPVYFGNAQNLAQGSQAANQPNAYAYTPVQYGSQIYGNGIPVP